MSNQIALVGFEEPHEKELTVYHEILPKLKTAVSEIGADISAITIKHGKTYSSVWYNSVLAFRMKLRGDGRYIEVPLESKDTVHDLGPLGGQKQVAGGFWRVKLSSEPVSAHADTLAAILQDAINRLPKEWDCCSRYMACSDAKCCVHPDLAFALKCGYRKILASGRVYYGENRNIDP